MKNHILISITCPELKLVNALNSDLDVRELNQKSMIVHVSGRSRLDVESYNTDFDSLNVRQRYFTEVIFEMADEIKSSGTHASEFA